VDTFTFIQVVGDLVASATWQALATPYSFRLDLIFSCLEFRSNVSLDGVFPWTESVTLVFAAAFTAKRAVLESYLTLLVSV